MFGQKKLIGLLISLFFLNTISFSQVYKAAVKSPTPVKNITWSDDETMFAYIEGSSIYIRSAKNYELLATISQKNIKSFGFSKQDNHNSILTLTSDGLFSIWDLSTVSTSKKNLEAEFTINFENVSDIKVISFSKTKDIIAASLGSNSLRMYDVDRVEKKAALHVLKEHQSKIYFTDFSSDSAYMVSASEDGVINIWDPEEQSVVLSMKGAFTQNHTPVRLTNDNRIIFSKNASTIVVSSFTGSLLGTIDVGDQIVDIKYLEKTNQLAVQTKKDDIWLFSLATFKKVGYMPTVIASAISSFDINKENTKILVAYGDGNVYKFNLDDVMLDPDQKVPDFKTEYKDAIDTVNINDSVIQIDDPMEKKKDGVQMPDTVYFNGGGGIITSTDLFTGSVYLGAEYRISQLFPPFYFGGGYEFSLGFPSSDFPYTYKFEGKVANSPMVYMNTLYAAGGFFVEPWGKDIYIVLHTKFGIRIISVAISAGGPYSISTTNCSVYLDAGFGAIYKMFECDLSCEYDVVNGFCPKISLGWNLKIPAWWKKK